MDRTPPLNVAKSATTNARPTAVRLQRPMSSRGGSIRRTPAWTHAAKRRCAVGCPAAGDHVDDDCEHRLIIQRCSAAALWPWAEPSGSTISHHAFGTNREDNALTTTCVVPAHEIRSISISDTLLLDSMHWHRSAAQPSC